MHYAKYQKGAVGSILMHSDRGIDTPDTHEHSNENIDSSRTHLNYDLKDRGGQSAYAYYKKRIEDIAAETKERTGKSIRKDAVTLCSWAVTAPKDLPEDKLPDFFKAAYGWFAERYGEGNIVTAAVHMDETTPHMHLQFTPIIEKNGVRKLCAKDMETRKTLQTAHQKLQKRLEQALGCEVNIINGATEQGNKSVLELQNETLKQQLAEKEEQAQQAEERANKAEKRAKAAEQKLKTVNGQFDVAAKELEKVLDKKARASEIKRSIFDRETQTYHKNMLESTRAIGYKAYEELTEANKVRQEAVSIQTRAEQKEQAIEPLYRQAQSAYQQAEQERKRQQQLRQGLEREIEKRADELSDKKIQEMFGGAATKRERRLEDFCEEIKFKDGSSVLDAFLEQEKQLKKSRYRGR